MNESRNCKRCDGSGISIRAAFTYEGRSYPENRSTCPYCHGAKVYPPVDSEAILAAIKGRKGMRTARPKDTHTIAGDRAYYVWRMARFHGGADVTMPMVAGMVAYGDPFTKELDALAEFAARKFCGTDLAAAHRWGRALGYLDRDMSGLPDSAYSGARVADEFKPEEETPELF